jgi:hypothetical protein
MTGTSLPSESGGTDITRFNALRHGVLSRYAVLPWEDEKGYNILLGALVVEHKPQGPTEEHLVEEIAGIIWRKRRLRLAEAAAHRRGLEGTLAPIAKRSRLPSFTSTPPANPNAWSTHPVLPGPIQRRTWPM